MKVICEYCGCSVEADENMKCPQCCAPLGDAIRAEEERLKKEAEEKEAAEKAEAEKKAAEAAKAEKKKTIINAIASIGSALFGAKTNYKRQPPPAPPRPYGEHRGLEQHRITEHRMPQPPRQTGHRPPEHERHSGFQGTQHSGGFGHRGGPHSGPGGGRHR